MKRTLFLTTAVLLFASCVSYNADVISEKQMNLTPDPKYVPDQVVRFQVEALQHNDVEDNGILLAFRFASPENKKRTGPFPRFTALLKMRHYRALLNHNLALYDRIEIYGSRARQRVTISGSDNNIISYVFYLSSQKSGNCVGCWMTDAVMIENVQSAVPMITI